ncbi:MAG: dockerin type I domain-containing protein, partial [Planctomycetota bacterium]
AEIRTRTARLETTRSGAPLGGISGWSELGPGNIGGRTRTLVIDHNNTDILYTGGVSGGLWKSVDAGASWTSLDDSMINLAISTIVMDPTNSDVLYAGTGEGVFTDGDGFPPGRGLGIYKSVDAGATWNILPATNNSMFHYVNKLAISPNDSDRLYAATRSGVWRSLNGGQDWSVVLANPTQTTGPASSNGCTVGCTDIELRSDTNPDTIWAAFGSFQSDGLFRSQDGGDTWVGYSVPTVQGRMELAIAPSDNDVMYISMAANGNGLPTGQLVQLYRTTDGGQTFTAQVDPFDQFGPWLLSNVLTVNGCIDYPTYSQGWYDNALAVDPVDPDIVWVGGIDLFRSDDGGVTWGQSAYYFMPTGNPKGIHADQHAVIFHPGYDGVSNQTMYVTNDGGVFRTDNARAATTDVGCPLNFPPGFEADIDWVNLNNGYGVTQFYHGAGAATTDLYVAGAQDNGTSGVFATNTPDNWQEMYGGDGGYVAIDPVDPDIIYAEIQFFPAMVKSTDGGQTFTDATNGITDSDGIFIVPFAMDPSDRFTLWTGGGRPWRTADGAAIWSVAGPQLFSFGGETSAIAIAPSDGNVVYFGSDAGTVARTTNGRDPVVTWTEAGLGSGISVGAWVSSIAVHPTIPTTAFLTYSNYGVPHVLKTTNGGATWIPSDTGLPDIPAHWIAFRPNNPTQMYVATELGVFASEDSGATWQPLSGVPNTIVESLDFPDNDRLVAFTYGRGAWLASFAPPPPACTGDVNGDDATNLSDFTILAANFGASGLPHGNGESRGVGDLNDDGAVNLADFTILAGDFGCSPST